MEKHLDTENELRVLLEELKEELRNPNLTENDIDEFVRNDERFLQLIDDEMFTTYINLKEFDFIQSKSTKRKNLLNYQLAYNEKVQKSLKNLDPNVNKYYKKVNNLGILSGEFPLIEKGALIFAKIVGEKYEDIIKLINFAPNTELEWRKREAVIKDIRKMIIDERKKFVSQFNSQKRINRNAFPFTKTAIVMISTRKYYEYLESTNENFIQNKASEFRNYEYDLFYVRHKNCSVNRKRFKRLQFLEILDIFDYTLRCII